MAFGFRTLVMVAAMSGASASADTASPQRPLQLRVVEAGQSVALEVVGSAPADCTASYELVVSGGQHGTNRSRQSGTARLRAGTTVTLVTLRLGQPANSIWSARLKVTPCHGPSYEEARSS